MMDSNAKGGERERFRATVHGHVQAVNFRYYTCRKAQQLNLVGTVRNRWDGTVEVIAEGPPDALHKLLSWLYAGPRLAHITRVQVAWQMPLGEFQAFEVRY